MPETQKPTCTCPDLDPPYASSFGHYSGPGEPCPLASPAHGVPMSATRIVPVDNKRPGQRLVCISCGQMIDADKAFADLNGEPFKAYYHHGCLPWQPTVPQEVSR